MQCPRQGADRSAGISRGEKLHERDADIWNCVAVCHGDSIRGAGSNVECCEGQALRSRVAGGGDGRRQERHLQTRSQTCTVIGPGLSHDGERPVMKVGEGMLWSEIEVFPFVTLPYGLGDGWTSGPGHRASPECGRPQIRKDFQPYICGTVRA